MIRVLHFSDVHVQAPVLSMPKGELVGKRFLAGANLWLVRGKLFRAAPQKLEALARFAKDERIDFVICTGDYTALGTEIEHALARQAIEQLTQAPLGFCTLPGNHDVYLDDTLRDTRFDRHFGPLMRSDLPERAVDGPFPFVRLVGDELAVIGVNSSKPNPNPFSSTGRIPEKQLEELAALLDDVDIRKRRVIVMTHYGVLRRDGSPDSDHHGLINVDRLMSICARPKVAVVHGHIHWRYHHAAAPGRPWLFCAGSATHRDREGLWVYEFDGGSMRALPGRFTGTHYALAPEQAVQVID